MTLSHSTADPTPRQDSRPHSRSDRAAAFASFHDPAAEPLSQRAYAEHHRLPRSTLGDWLRQPTPDDVEPELAAFLRGPAGERFLRRIHLALHLVFRHHLPGGLRQISLFLNYARLDAFVAASYGAQYDFDQALQQLLTDFGGQQRAAMASQMREGLVNPEQPRGILACLDEHFHAPTPCLVAIEPCSNFILTEAYAERRDAVTWTEALQRGLSDLPVRLVGLVSDDAAGLRRCATHGLQVHRSPDLMHLQNQLTGPVLQPLARRIQQCQQRLKTVERTIQEAEAARDDPASEGDGGQTFDRSAVAALLPLVREQVAAEGRLAEATRRHEEAVEQVWQLGDAYHPYDAQTGQPLGEETLTQRLQGPVRELARRVREQHLGEKAARAVGQAGDWLTVLVGCVAWYFGRVAECLDGLGVSEAARGQLERLLLPGLYWRAQAPRARDPEERRRLAALGERLVEEAWHPGGALGALPAEVREKLERIGSECVGWFGRSSSCVEGRNGRLGFYQLGQTRLAARRLGVLTVMHNYVVRREDGSTAAERFFGVKQGDAFTWLLERMPDLPRPAARRPKKVSPQGALAG